MRARLLVLVVIGLIALWVACLPSCVPPSEPAACTAESFCEEVNARYKADIGVIVASMNSCEERADCVSAVPTLGCPDQATWLTTCPQGIRADALETFDDEVAALEATYCESCDLECHHDDEVACSAPIAKCIDGRCVVEFAEDFQVRSSPSPSPHAR